MTASSRARSLASSKKWLTPAAALLAAFTMLPRAAGAQIGDMCSCPYVFATDPGPGADCAFSNAVPGRLRNGQCMAPGCAEMPCIISGSIWAIDKFGEKCGSYVVVQDGNPILATTNPGISLSFTAYLECGSWTRYEIYAGGRLEVGVTLACGTCAASGQ